MDVDNFLGQPYNYIKFSKQTLAFEINGKNFVSIEDICVFTKDFPNTAEGKPADIFIQDFELIAAVPLDEAALNNYHLALITPKGTFFPELEDGSLKEEASQNDTLTLEAEVKVKGKIVSRESESLKFYWFIEHAGVNSKHPHFNVYGGQGWKCLNKYNKIEGAKDTDGKEISEGRVEWIPGTYNFEIKKSDCLTKAIKYKCVCLYGDINLEKEIIIKNKDAKQDIQIVSSNGTEFFYDQGNTSLECKFDKDENLRYNYYWARVNNNNNYESLIETSDANILYHQGEDFKKYIEEKYAEKKDVFKTTPYQKNATFTDLEDYLQKNYGVKNSATYDDYYNAVVKYLNDKTITRVEKGILHNLQIYTITKFANYSCSVFRVDVDKDGNDKEVFIGTGSIKIANIFEEQRGYSLLINNGNQIFKYNESGVSPAHESNEHPQQILPLTFSLFDENGNLVSDEDIRQNCKVKWIVPNKDTMLQSNISENDKDSTSMNGFDIYSKTFTFDYDITHSFSANRNRNDIELEVTYRGKTLRAKTNFTFVKEGDSGTNGTDYICKIVLNSDDAILPQCPTLYFLPNDNYEMNYRIKGSGGAGTNPSTYKEWLKVQLWKMGDGLVEQITDNYTVKWSILSNKYDSSHSDPSFFSVTEDGIFTPGTFGNSHPANIVKATITLDEKQYFATMPITTVKIENNNYRATIKNNTGYNFVTYSSDGTNPQYDTNNPFEVEIFNNNVNITTKNTLTFEWSQLGRYYQKGWKAQNLFKMPTNIPNTTNPLKVSPVNSYDGYVVTASIVANVKDGDTQVAKIYKPVHFLINRYGHSALNDWDGNSITINENEGMILSPQIGAGKKDPKNNTFTGLVMGTVQDSGGEKTGLVGYSQGQRSIFLDAETGKAEFGLANSGGQIILDPDPTQGAVIQSAAYTQSGSTKGMKIDLLNSTIHYKSGNFSVTEDGYLTAEGGGKIAGWTIGDKRLTSGKTGMSSDNSSTSNLAFWAGSNFSVTHGGYLKASSGKIGGWYLTSNTLSTVSGDSTSDFRLSSADFSRTINKIARKKLRLAIGNNFAVDSSGTLYADKAVLTNAVIGDLDTKGKLITFTKSSITYISSVSLSKKTSSLTGFASSTIGDSVSKFKIGMYTFYAFDDKPTFTTKSFLNNDTKLTKSSSTRSFLATATQNT